MSQSGFAQDDLATILKLIRSIAQMGDTEATAALDALLHRLSQSATSANQVTSPATSWGEQAERRLLAEIEKLRNAIEDPVLLAPWQPALIRQQADQLDQWLAIDPRHTERVGQLRATVAKVAADAEYALARRSMADALTRPIHSTASARSILAGVEDSRQQLMRLGRLTGENDALLRQAKERAAWYRSRKCLDDAEVAAAGGNTKKVTKLRAEAAVLLRQDWNDAFPGEQPPAVPTIGAT